jgi:glycine dehydrogenase subunit 1
VTRGEFYSAYTPYQAEASQGTLQLLYEFQTMMARLTGMQVSNASLYDGGSALAEACLMAVRAHRRSKSQRILVPAASNPTYVDVARAIAGNQNLVFETLAYEPKSGRTVLANLEGHRGQDVTALVIQQPNFFGTLEDVDALTDLAHELGMLVIASVNPTSLAILKPPGEWGQRGADIVCGDGQPLGVPLSSGGPYFGFMTTRLEHVRQMPGRLIGRTFDLDGKQGFTLTLQAREQHIRRGKATSNICTNQGLLGHGRDDLHVDPRTTRTRACRERLCRAHGAARRRARARARCAHRVRCATLSRSGPAARPPGRRGARGARRARHRRRL